MQWWTDYFGDVDAKDLDRIGAWLAEDASFCFNNGPAVVGKSAIKEYLGEFFKCFDTLTHRHGPLISEGDNAAGEAEVIYGLHDGRQVKILANTVIERQNGLIQRLHAYLDISLLYSALQNAP